MKKIRYRKKTTFEKKKTPGLVRVDQVMSGPVRSTRFYQIVALVGLLSYPDRFNHRID